MIQHIVLFRWSSDAAAIAEAKRRVLALAGIAEVQGLVAGANIARNKHHDFVWGFSFSCADDAALQRYLVHPLHLALGEIAPAATADVLVADIEV